LTCSTTRSSWCFRGRMRRPPGSRSKKAREIGAKTQRERDWIEALSAYYRDHAMPPTDSEMISSTVPR
jgi:hypothetical protein